ncbi:hypothetical protein ACP70R_046337 [Stipagrostis hirtigluma subsp. patula]
MEGSELYLWSRESGPDGKGWTQSKVIELKTLIPFGAILVSYDVLGFTEGGGVVYMRTDHGSFTADMKSGQLKKLGGVSSAGIVAYMSFCTLDSRNCPLHFHCLCQLRSDTQCQSVACSLQSKLLLPASSYEVVGVKCLQGESRAIGV